MEVGGRGGEGGGDGSTEFHISSYSPKSRLFLVTFFMPWSKLCGQNLFDLKPVSLSAIGFHGTLFKSSSNSILPLKLLIGFLFLNWACNVK